MDIIAIGGGFVKKFAVIICFFIVFGFTTTVLGNAAKPTYVNRHYFLNGTYDIIEQVISEPITWTKSRSPYVVEDRIIISSAGTLSIEAGVKVLFKNPQQNSVLNFVVENGGELNIYGSFGNQVVFSKFSEDEDDWNSINFENGSFGNINFGEFKFGGKSSESIMNIASSNVNITNTKFTNSSSSGISIIGAVDPNIDSTGFDLDNEYVILQKDVNADPKLKDLFSYENLGKIKIEAGTYLGDISSVSRSIIWEDPSIPYVIDGWFKIGPNGTLNIEPSVKVLFSKLDTTLKGNITVSYRGHLVAKGVDFNSELVIEKSEDKENNWDYIYGEAGAILNIKDCIINNGGYSDKGTLRINANDADINSTTISNSSSHGIYIGKSDISPLFKDMIIEGSNGYGIYLKENAKPKFDGILQRSNWRDGVFVESLDLYRENTWSSDEGPYYLSGIYNINSGATLDIGPGTTVYFDESDNLKKSSIIVEENSEMTSRGTSENPVIFTSSNTYPNSGDWGSIVLRKDSMGRFHYSIFEYGGENDFLHLDGGSTNYGVLNTFTNNLVLHNSSFRNLKNNGVYIGDNVAPYSIMGNKLDISSNNFGVYKWDKDINVHATHNWWNHITGPYNVNINPGGYGAMVSDEVNVFPLLKNAYEKPNIIKTSWNRQITTNSNKTWSIKFNYFLDPKYVNTSYINVLDSEGEYIEIEISLSGNTILVKPKNSYNVGKYTLVIKDGIKSNSGKTLNKVIKMEFEVY